MDDNYPLLDLFWTMLLIFCWVLWFFLLFRIIGDLFRDHTVGGWAKAGWLILLIFLPFIGVLIYIIARGKGMAERDQRQAKEMDAAFRQYVREAASGDGGAAGGGVDQLAKLAELKGQGHISEEEYAKAKAKFLT